MSPQRQELFGPLGPSDKFLHFNGICVRLSHKTFPVDGLFLLCYHRLTLYRLNFAPRPSPQGKEAIPI